MSALELATWTNTNFKFPQMLSGTTHTDTETSSRIPIYTKRAEFSLDLEEEKYMFKQVGKSLICVIIQTSPRGCLPAESKICHWAGEVGEVTPPTSRSPYITFLFFVLVSQI